MPLDKKPSIADIIRQGASDRQIAGRIRHLEATIDGLRKELEILKTEYARRAAEQE